MAGLCATSGTASAQTDGAAAPTIASDLADYNPGGLVTLTGSGWAPGEVVHITVNDTLGQTWRHDADVTATDAGDVTDVFNLPNYFVSDYDVTATGPVSGRATTTFTDANPSANLDQCANDPAPSPPTDGCSASAIDWVNGNLGASKSVYLEGDSIPYRLTMDNLTLSSHTVTIEWDTTKSSKHALDYLTTYNRTVATANPCLGVTGCGSPSTFPIPADPQVTGAGVTPVPGGFTMFGGTITAVSAYSYPDGAGFVGDKTARITVTFKANQVNPVLAWGGHISSRANWGADGAAVAIPGSPYHTRLIDLDGSGGNQDRSLSADAVIFPGSITIVKQASPEGSTIFPFTASPAPLTSFPLVDNGTSANTRTFAGITNFATYTVAETVPTGWSLTGATCSATSANGGSQKVLGATATIDLAEGENVTCTYNNQRQTAGLVVIKHVVNDNGGTASAGDFTMSVNGVTADGGNSFPGAESPGTSKTLSTVGAYTVTESGPSGYTATYSADCDATIAFGQTKTCTVTNNDNPAHLKLVKVVTNDDGGAAVATDFTVSAAGPTPVSGPGTAESDVNAGTYTLSESGGPAGYTGGSWSCTGGTQVGDKVTLKAGESATCTITNNDQTAHLTLVKKVVNDNGGTAEVKDVTLTATGPVTISGPGGADADVKAGTYALSETALPGYTAGSWSCAGGSQDGDKVTLALGQSATCTITNDDKAPKLTLVKQVVNDNGGTAKAGDWTLTATGYDPAGPKAGTYALSESGGPDGYTRTSLTCSNSGTDQVTEVTLGLGDDVTCTFVNDDQAPKLTLEKKVVNDNGGTAVAGDFTLTADGTGANDISGAGGATSGAALKADTFSLSETNVAGYSASAWTCVGGTQTGASIAVGIGQSATCTITNDDRAAHLTLVKQVTNDNGGTAERTDFTLSATGPSPISGKGGAEADVNAGTYALSETDVAGYAAGDWSCVGGTQSGASVSLALGESATCTINNNDIPATLELVKEVVNDNGGSASADAFTLSAAGPTPLSGKGGIGGTVDAGSYSLSETNLPGYTAGSWSCTGDGTLSGDTIKLALGEKAVCTIVNDDQPAHLKLVKTVTTDNGGTAKATDFTLSAAGPSPISGAGGAEADVNAGSYTLSETNLAGYTASAWSCDGGTQTGASVSLAVGESATCTITNDDQTAHLKLVKVVTNDNGGTKTAADFTVAAAGPTPISGAGGVDKDVNAGTYTLSETGPDGYKSSGWSCSGGGTQDGDKITLTLGQTATCTITNDDVAPKLTLVKQVVNDNGGTALPGAWTLKAGNFDPAKPQVGNYTLSESGGPVGYTQTSLTCSNSGTAQVTSVTLGLGDDVTCTFVNDDQPGKIVVVKNAKPAQGSFAFTTTGTGYSGFSLTGATANGGNTNTQTLNAGTYTVKESTQLGWILTGLGGSADPNTPYNCVVTGSGGSTGVGDLNTQTATISLKNGDTVTCTFENTGQGVTRTQGFWATHSPLANIAWFGGTAYGHTFPGVANTSGIGDNLVCGRSVDQLGKLTAAFWADVAKTSTGSKRSTLDQARMQLLQQLVAAELNASAFGSVPSGGSGMFAQWESALCGTNTTTIKNAQAQAAAFNTQGDSGTFTPGTSADSKNARSIANIPFWDVIKP